MPSNVLRTFHWEDCAEVLQELWHRTELALELDPARGAFTGPTLRVVPPPVLPIPAGCASLADYLSGLPAEPGRHVVLLLQAGAVSLGRFEAGQERATKSFKRYVVRGKGRAQPGYLATRGKSRYGSRLRLQNARRLLEETNEKLRAWDDELGPADAVFYSAPIRIWPDLFLAKPPPPFEKEDAIRVPLDLPKPTTDVLRRTYKALCYGRVEALEDVARGPRSGGEPSPGG